MNTAEQLIATVRDWSQTDKNRLFNFTSGHLGALPLSDKFLLKTIVNNNFLQTSKNGLFLAKEFIKLIVLTLLPVKNLALILRTVLRRICSNKNYSIHSITVISLGNQSSAKDSYFGVLLNSLEKEFDYLKIVGGFNFQSRDYMYVESALGYLDLLRLTAGILVLPLVTLWYLINKSWQLRGFNNIVTFITLGLKEINVGAFCNNKIIVKSINSWLKNNKTRKILYPMEGRNWEKNIVEVMNDRKIYSIGYIHCALTPRHLSLTQAGFYKPQEVPSLVVAPGEMITQLMHEVFPNKIIRSGYFLRGSKDDASNLKKINLNTLQFALTGNIAESTKIIDCIAASNIQQKYQVTIRLNPNTVSYGQLSKYVKKLGLKLYSADDEFLPSICFFRSSSVALDYLKLNVMPVYLNLDEIISNNVFDLDVKYEFRTLNVNELIGEQVDTIVNNRGELIRGVEISKYYLQNFTANDAFSNLLD
jgi:hypothetical protein